jgi:asparagine synthase (glutamine-hydrolysing)
MYFDQILWLSMESNRRLDRVSMAFSIEARSPFQDDNIREMFLREEEKKIKKFIGKKQLLMAFPELSTHINSREKLGFVSPVGHWMRQNQGDVTKEIAILARRKEFRSFATIDINEALYSKHFKTLRKIWTLYVLAKWLSRDENIQ